MMLFIELVAAIVVGEWAYSWVCAMQSVVIGRYFKRKYMNQINNRILEQMPVGQAN